MRKSHLLSQELANHFETDLARLPKRLRGYVEKLLVPWDNLGPQQRRELTRQHDINLVSRLRLADEDADFKDAPAVDTADQEMANTNHKASASRATPMPKVGGPKAKAIKQSLRELYPPDGEIPGDVGPQALLNQLIEIHRQKRRPEPKMRTLMRVLPDHR